MRRYTVNVVTEVGGAFIGYTPNLRGKVHSIAYIKTDFTDGVDFTITNEDTGETLWTEANVNAAKVCYPRAATHSTAGVASLYASGGTAVQAPPGVVGRIKVAIAAGGDGKIGTFVIMVEN